MDEKYHEKSITQQQIVCILVLKHFVAQYRMQKCFFCILYRFQVIYFSLSFPFSIIPSKTILVMTFSLSTVHTMLWKLYFKTFFKSWQQQPTTKKCILCAFSPTNNNNNKKNLEHFHWAFLFCFFSQCY